MPLSLALRRLFSHQCRVEPLKLLWKLHSLDHRFASARYRALLPIQALSRHGYRSTIVKTIDLQELQGYDVLIFVRSFSMEDLLVAQAARDFGVSVVIDI